MLQKNGCKYKIEKRMAKSVYPDETTHYQPFHWDFHCLQRYLVLSAGLKWLNFAVTEYYIILTKCRKKKTKK